MIKPKFTIDTSGLKSIKLGDRKTRIIEGVAKNLLRRCESFVPEQSGKLKSTGKVEGKNKLTWSTRYARQQFYHGKGTGKRGRKWVFRAWHKNKRLILKEVQSTL